MNYVSFLYSHDKAKLFDLFSMLCPCTHDINPGRVDAAVSQNIGQFGAVFLNTVKSPGKQLAQIVGEHFACLYTGCFAKGFHLGPDVAPIQRLAVPGNKDWAGMDTVILRVIQEQLSQLAGQQNRPGLALAADCDLSTFHSFQSEEPQL